MPRSVLSLVGLLLLAALAACGSGGENPEPPDVAPALHWSPESGAERYRVQAWSGLRLLFEETVADTTLVVTPAMLRAAAPFDSVTVQVRSIAGEAMGAPRRIRWREAG